MLNFHIILKIYLILYFSVLLPGKICHVHKHKPLLHSKKRFPDNIFSSNFTTNNSSHARFTKKGWCASSGSSLSIDLLKEYHITQVVTMGKKNQENLTWSESYLLDYSHNKTFVNGNSSVQVWFNIHFNAKNPREISGSVR